MIPAPSTSPLDHARPRLRRRSRQGGFNFAEVLFAVMILALGFIMIAALFPVALRQTQLNGEEVVASTSARSGTNFLEQVGLTRLALPVTVQTIQSTTVVAPNPAHPANAPARIIPDGQSRAEAGVVYSFRDPRILDPDGGPTGYSYADVQLALWRQVNGNLILPSDNRSAWVGLYRRGARYTNPTSTPPAPLAHTAPAIITAPAPYAQVFLIGVQARNRSAFEQAKDARRFPNDVYGDLPASLEPRLVFVKLHEGEGQVPPIPDRITFHATNAANAAVIDVPVAAEGAFVIISDDQFTYLNNPGDTDQDPSTTVIEQNGQSNGRIYRLATKVDNGTWELALGWDMTLDKGNNLASTADDIHQNIPPRDVTLPILPVPAGLPALAFIVGRGWTDPTTPGDYEGPAQETGVYTTFIQAN